MKLGEIGEFELIGRIAPLFPSPADGTLGIGDDCAVLPLAGELAQLVTTDLLIESVHFRRDWISPEDLGHKSLAVNLSDIAAMGGTPTAAFLSVGFPATLDVTWLDRFFAGIRQLADTAHCPLLGGDTTKSDGQIVINFTVIGTAAKENLKCRDGAKAGDVIAVTGFLGDSGAGLRLLQEEAPKDDPHAAHLIEAHHCPHPHLAEGQWLAGHRAVHAMMDLSDGIDSDLRRIMERSQLGAAVDLDALPLSRPLQAVCASNAWPAHEIAVAGGEDYCLLCTVEADRFPALAAAFESHFEKPLYNIGAIRETCTLIYRTAGKAVDLSRHGFDHFRI